MISNEKKKLLHVGKRELGLSDEQYRQILREHTDCASCADSDFTDQDFKKVIDHFKILGFEVRRRVEGRGSRGLPHEPPNVGQLRLLAHIWEEWWDFYIPLHPEARTAAFRAKFEQGFNKRMIKTPWPQSRRDANIVVEAMKARLRRAIMAAGGPGIGAREEG